MKLTVLGSGSIIAREHACTGFLIENGNAKIVVDLGSGAFHYLKKACEPANINNLLITHMHADHCAGIASFLLYKSLAFRFGLSKNKAQLNILGPKGIAQHIEKLRELYKLNELPFRIFVKELERSFIMLPGFRIKSMPTRHENCIAYRIEASGKAIVFSADTAYFEAIASFANNADLFVLECSLPDNIQSAGHLTVSQAASLAKLSNAKAVLLHHFFPQLNKESIEEAFKNIYSGKVYIADELMKIEL